mmetsp:Transcript_39086/g.84119  ORF Transcript_39086/g.84119 Transcript_39086/m.84119 type:complete len:281 (+) Transcript_39086:219-1061(+)
MQQIKDLLLQALQAFGEAAEALLVGLHVHLLRRQPCVQFIAAFQQDARPVFFRRAQRFPANSHFLIHRLKYLLAHTAQDFGSATQAIALHLEPCHLHLNGHLLLIHLTFHVHNGTFKLSIPWRNLLNFADGLQLLFASTYTSLVYLQGPFCLLHPRAALSRGVSQFLKQTKLLPLFSFHLRQLLSPLSLRLCQRGANHAACLPQPGRFPPQSAVLTTLQGTHASFQPCVDLVHLYLQLLLVLVAALLQRHHQLLDALRQLGHLGFGGSRQGNLHQGVGRR